MKQKEGFVLRTVCGENVVIGEGITTVNIGKFFSLNETAAWLWKKAAELGNFTDSQLADALCEEYEVNPEQALTDVRQMLAQWQKDGIIEDEE